MEIFLGDGTVEYFIEIGSVDEEAEEEVEKEVDFIEEM
jgi:hypothetical protein